MPASESLCRALQIFAVPAILIPSVALANEATFTPLGDLPGGAIFSTAYAVSGDGIAVVGRACGADGYEAFRWLEATGLQGLGDLAGGSFASVAYAVSSDGLTVVGTGTSQKPSGSDRSEAFRWTEATGMVGLGSLCTGAGGPQNCLPEWAFSEAYAVSADGEVVVGATQSDVAPVGERVAFRWESGVMVSIGSVYMPDCLGIGVPCTRGEARSISASGDVIVGTGLPDGCWGSDAREALRWDWPTNPFSLGLLPGGECSTEAHAVSADGAVVVGLSGDHLFRWTASEGMQSLSDQGTGLSLTGVGGMSADGSVMVGSCDGQAAIWTESNGVQILSDLLVGQGVQNLDGWVLTAAADVSDDGMTIVGNGTNPSGEPEAWIARFPPLLETIDYNDARFRDESVPLLDRLWEGGDEVLGLAADGVTRVLIRTPSYASPGEVCLTIEDESAPPSTDPADVGTLHNALDDQQCGNPLALTLQEMPGTDEFKAFAILTAPLDFVRPAHAAEDEQMGVNNPRQLTISMHYESEGGEPCGQTPDVSVIVALHRPPVVLLHGLWGDQTTWHEPGLPDWPLLSDTRFDVYPHEYKGSNARPFVDNRFVCRAAVKHAVGHMRAQSIAATQADVVGHSMGGVLARVFSRGEFLGYPTYYLRERGDCNFNAGDIHKLITLDTPHLGSELANVLVFSDGTRTGAGVFYENLNSEQDVDGGAVRDLRVDSLALFSLNHSTVSLPVHAMYGTGGTEYPGEGYAPALNAAISAWCFHSIDDLFYWPHDVIVGAPSQRGGLPGDAYYHVPGLYTQHGNGRGVTHSQEASAHVVDLLNASTRGPLFADGFPIMSALTPPDCGSRQRSDPDLGVAIIGPPSGSEVMGGQIIEVEVIGVSGFEPTSVSVLCSTSEVVTDEQAPFVVSVEVPASCVGSWRVAALGTDAQGQSAYSEILNLTAIPPAALTGITVEPSAVELFSFSGPQALYVEGTFADGIKRDVTASSTGTAYQVADDSIVAIDAEGMMIGIRAGSTSVMASNAGQSASLSVTVASVYADANADGLVDWADFEALVACLDGPGQEVGVECADAFDFLSDGDVDLGDFASFQLAFTGASR